MPTTICEICKKDFKFPSKLKRHLQRKISCKSDVMGVISQNEKKTLKNPQKPSKTLKNPQSTSLSLISDNIAQMSDTCICEYCHKILPHSKNYKRHLRTTCHKIPESLKKKIIKKYEANQNHLNALDVNNISKVNNDKKNNSVINIKKLIINNDNTINNTLNNNNNVNNNLINNDNTINNTLNNNTQNNNVNNTNLINMGLEKLIINPMGKEDLSKISNSKKKEIINSGKGMFKNMMNAILELPENWNFYILNRKEKIGVFLNMKNELEAEKLNLVLKESVLNYYNMIYDIYTEIENELTDKEKKEHNIEYNKMEPVNKNQLLEDTVLFKLVSISKKCKIALDKYMKILEEREELSLENK